jgi:hypothetical protein
MPYVEIRASSNSLIPKNRSLWDSEKSKVIQVADKALSADISRIREKYRVREVGKFDLGMSMFGGGEIIEQRKVKIYFDVGTNLSHIEKLLTQSKIHEAVIPETYRVQVLNATRFANADVERLKSKFPFIRSIAQN